MSVYIKRMEMPENCDKCIYSGWSNWYQMYVCNAVKKENAVLFDRNTTKSVATMRSGRADNCPLIPVTDHGRLIDADALEEKTDDRYSLGEIGRRERDDIVNALRYCASTIIPASKEGEA